MVTDIDLMRRTAWLVPIIAAGLLARTDAIRYLHWDEIQPVFAAFAAAGIRAPTFSDVAEFDGWIRQRDADVHSRIDRGLEDSISALALTGSSFTTLPKIANAGDAVNAAGDLTPAARSRVQAFVQGIDEQDQERFALVREFLSRQRVPEEEVRAFVIGIVRRFALEQAGFQRKHAQGPLRLDGGIGTETSLPVGYAIEDTLANLKSRGAIPARIRRIAVIGPGLDFAGPASDAFPPQSIQPFAVLESVLRLGLAQPADVEITAFDLSPSVLMHLKMLPAKVRGGRYVLQLPPQATAGWNAGVTAYWQHFGDLIGKPVKSQFAARILAEELNIVTQTREAPAGQGFDLVVATNVLLYYNPLEQAMALTNIAQMLASGGIFLANNPLPTDKVQALEYLGVRRVSFTDNGAGDDIVTFRRR
jgi:CheR methyltransferase, SAM binding domain